MKSHPENLLRILEEISGLYESLEGILKKEKLSLIQNSLDDIVEGTKQKETITLKLSMLEESREKVISEMSGILEKPKGEIDLTLLSKDPDPLTARRFAKLKETLTPLLKRVGQLQRENRCFIEESIKGISSTFSFFNKITSETKTYRGSGEYGTLSNGATGKVVCQQI
ncbi:MAG: flagellar protein FlgN [Nitrospinota bacterium]